MIGLVRCRMGVLHVAMLGEILEYGGGSGMEGLSGIDIVGGVAALDAFGHCVGHAFVDFSWAVNTIETAIM